MVNEPDRRTITLVGQSKSGKTNLLSTLFYNPNVWDDAEQGAARVEKATIQTAAGTGTAEEKNFYDLSVHQKNILHGRDHNNEGTDMVRHYSGLLEYDDPSRTIVTRTFFRRSQTAAAPRTVLPFTIVDGRGGDIAAAEYVDPDAIENKGQLSRINDYRLGLDKSSGMVICMPILKEEFATEIADQLLREITAAIRRKEERPKELPPLQRIALVFTKYEALFAREGAMAGQRASDPQEALHELKGQAILRRFAPIFHKAGEKDGYETRVFPASTFGFVAGDGAANFYDYPLAPGLLCRAIEESDYDDPGLSDPGAPGLRDHFPLPLSEKDAMTLWRPFNIAPPILYALTGRETGPLVFEPAQLF